MCGGREATVSSLHADLLSQNLDEVKLDEDGLVTFEAYLKYMVR